MYIDHVISVCNCLFRFVNDTHTTMCDCTFHNNLSSFFPIQVEQILRFLDAMFVIPESLNREEFVKTGSE